MVVSEENEGEGYSDDEEIDPDDIVNISLGQSDIEQRKSAIKKNIPKSRRAAPPHTILQE